MYKAVSKVSVVVVDSVTLGHPCCTVHNCYVPLTNNHQHFCPDHAGLDKECAIVRCHLLTTTGHCTCSLPEHCNIKDYYLFCGQSWFQLQDCLVCAQIAHPNDALAQDVDITQLTDQPTTEEEFEVDEGGRGLLATADSSIAPNHTIGTAQPPRQHNKIKTSFRQHWICNEELIVAPCGLIIVCQIFYGAEGVASVAVSQTSTVFLFQVARFFIGVHQDGL